MSDKPHIWYNRRGYWCCAVTQTTLNGGRGLLVNAKVGYGGTPRCAYNNWRSTQ